MLWQSIGVAGALAAVAAGLSVAVAPLHTGILSGVIRLENQGMAGRPLQDLGLAGALGLELATDVVTILVLGLALAVIRAARARSRHRGLLTLIADRSDRVPGALLLDDQRATAYYLPGIRPRIVLSTGTLVLLDSDELSAVVAHERGHQHARHDLAMLPFASMNALLAWVPYVHHARKSVATLFEMAADDFAAKRADPRALASALVEMSSSGSVLTCAFGIASTGVTARVCRLLQPTRTSPKTAAIALSAALGVVALPLVALLVP
ncbi:MAG: M56 family metallopeptidase [Acidimicrobiales bacterium]